MYLGIRSKCCFDMSLITGSTQKYFFFFKTKEPIHNYYYKYMYHF